MNDYLGRAVDREMSDIAAVRPALPSLFEPGEPPAIFSAPETESPIESEQSRSARAETIPDDSPAVAAPLAAVSALWADAAANTEPPGTTEATAGKTPERVVARPVAPSTLAESHPESRSLAEQPQSAEPVVRPIPGALPRPPIKNQRASRTNPPVPAAEHVVERVSDSPLEGPPAISISTDAPISPIANATTVDRKTKSNAPLVRATTVDAKHRSEAPIPRATTADAKTKSEGSPVVAPMPRAVRPVVPPVPEVVPAPARSERAANSRIARHDTSSRRTIHITIGRIEVRAVHPPPEPLPPPRPAPASPKISLDEYLKQRNGDRR